MLYYIFSILGISWVLSVIYFAAGLTSWVHTKREIFINSVVLFFTSFIFFTIITAPFVIFYYFFGN